MQAEKLVFISSMAAVANGGDNMEELDISALYYAALEEADGTVILDEGVAHEINYYEQVADELETEKSADELQDPDVLY